MINLLPPDVKQAIIYGRRNRQLAKWTGATLGGIAGIGLVIAAGLVYINLQTNAYAKQVERAKASLADQQMEATVARIGEIDASVRLALNVLSREVRFSELLRGLGAAMPPGAVLQNLSIGDVQGALDLQAIAANYETATQVQVNLQDPRNKIFEKADIVSITCAAPAAGRNERYPCQVSIRALFAKDSPYLFSVRPPGGATP